MYLKYDTDQTSFGRRKATSWKDIGSFRPTWLVRVADMQKVPGSEAASGYCALSYSWNYSGKIITDKDGKSDYVDEGKHEIITHRWNPEQMSERESVTKYVKFDDAIQHICQDFGVDYIWYDKRCIDQTNKKEKLAEIKKMHLVYKNALFSVVLIPELDPPSFNLPTINRFKQDPFDAYCLQAILKSEWCTRMWTLEEAVLSQKMVFVGRTVHFWSYQMKDLFFHGKSDEHRQLLSLVEDLCGNETDAAKILHFAHRRESTKTHDKIFALANIYADIVDIDVNYDTELSVVMLQFYTSLARSDHTILCFGKSLGDYPSTMSKFPLPSWTGVAGVHVLLARHNFLLKPPETHILVMQNDLHVTCDYITLVPGNLTSDTAQDVHYLENSFNIKITHCALTKKAALNSNSDQWNTTPAASECLADDCLADQLGECSFDDGDFFDCEDEYHPMAFMSLTEDCKKCYVLDISFIIHPRHGIFRPVVGWDENLGAFKAIGVYIIYLYWPSLTKVPLHELGDVDRKKFIIQ